MAETENPNIAIDNTGNSVVHQILLGGRISKFRIDIKNTGNNPLATLQMQRKTHQNSDWTDVISSLPRNDWQKISRSTSDVIREISNLAPGNLASGQMVSIDMKIRSAHSVRFIATSISGTTIDSYVNLGD